MDRIDYDISIEATPSGQLLPTWLERELVENSDNAFLLIYPSEAARQATVRELSIANPSIDSSKHLTINRLVRALLTDFRQPNVFDDNSLLLYQTHQHCVESAIKGKFPLLHMSGKKWSISKTQRLISLHKEISKLANIPQWESDPGVREFRRILFSIEKTGAKTHPDLMNYHLNSILQNLDDSKLPFTLKGLKGIILLDHAPEFCQIERHILTRISQFIPIHQLCYPGQFRLGHSGAYLQDVAWCSQSNLPTWVPKHEVQEADFYASWRSKISVDNNTQYHKVVVERSTHVIEATTNLLNGLDINSSDKIVVIDASLDNRGHRWHEMLRQLGIYSNLESTKVSREPLIQELIFHLELASGLESWSFERLRRLANSAMLSVDLDVVHPTDPEIIPRPHIDILQNIARSFHVLGGPGAAERWITTLSNASRQIGDYDDSQSVKQEETQWWLANIIRLWQPISDSDFNLTTIDGCFTGEQLPLVSALTSPRQLLSRLVRSIDWTSLMADDSHYNNCLNAVEALESKLRLIETEGLIIDNNLNFIELVKLIVDSEEIEPTRIECQNVVICSPEMAFGQSANLVILAGLDSESWSMKPRNVPWLDNATKIKLGLTNSDIKIRQGRHHLRHILNSAKSVIVIDTSLDEAARPSPPLAEWLADVEHDNSVFGNLPEFIDVQSYSVTNINRPWDLVSSDNGVALKLRMFSTEFDDSKPISTRPGNRGRDIRQRSSLALLSDRPVELLPNNKSSIAAAYELPIYTKLRNLQPSLKSLEVGSSMKWDERNNMVSFTPLNLQPSAQSAKADTRTLSNWPNLGHRVNGNTVSPSIDPRPLPLLETLPDSIRSVTGDTQLDLRPEVWSSYRLQTWLKCPRQAWLTNYLKLIPSEVQTQDIDNRTRGLLMHDIEAKIFSINGVPIFDKPLLEARPLHLSTHNSLDVLWQTALNYLAKQSPWLSRKNAVSVHRCREIIGTTPGRWQDYLDGVTELTPSGKIGNYLTATLSLNHSAPLVCEWPIQTATTKFVKIAGLGDGKVNGEFLLRGRIDRVDQLLMPNSSETRRLVIIRDMKTVNGPKKKQRGERHRRAIFDELQLALYAKAWEAAHPDDRVVGVGITEVGDDTEYYVEIDPEYLDLIDNLAIGKVTTYTSNTYRDLDEAIGGKSNGFRAWLDERVRTAMRVIDSAKTGNVNPTVSDDCKFCKVRRACPSAKLGGKP